ncbi:hypothetical protein GCM10009681_48480 [Luedemannella helvata]|uniref:SWIM-type domain-containing protein n=2 Tax=Luedemannella helvata TaxID=349315 RepID=A0ABN2L0W0_9ACTN
MDSSTEERRSTARVVSPVRPRKLAKVPFVEMAEGRLQGVVSSGSDIDRVYVSSVTVAPHGLSCSTNNNRPCGGLRDAYPCKHITALVAEADLQYGTEQVARFLRLDMTQVSMGTALTFLIKGHHQPTPAATVFSSFLHHLAYLELPQTTAPLPELHWFPATGAVR